MLKVSHHAFFRITVFVFCLFTSGCATIPSVHSQVTDAERKAVLQDLEKRKNADEPMNDRLREMGKKIIAANAVLSDQKVEFKVGGSQPGINAYTDGKHVVYFTRQMMRFLTNDDELAYVVSHELAHIQKGHYTKNVVGHTLTSAVAIAAATYAEKYVKGTGQITAPAIDAVAWSPFSKQMEMEADDVSIVFMKKAGFDPKQALAVMKRFAIEMPRTDEPSWVSTHPPSPERLSNMTAIIEKGAA
jgi:predicted Zn-dependent protease